MASHSVHRTLVAAMRVRVVCVLNRNTYCSANPGKTELIVVCLPLLACCGCWLALLAAGPLFTGYCYDASVKALRQTSPTRTLHLAMYGNRVTEHGSTAAALMLVAGLRRSTGMPVAVVFPRPAVISVYKPATVLQRTPGSIRQFLRLGDPFVNGYLLKL